MIEQKIKEIADMKTKDNFSLVAAKPTFEKPVPNNTLASNLEQSASTTASNEVNNQG